MKKIIIILLLLLSLDLYSKELSYNFSWLGIKTAELVIIFDDIKTHKSSFYIKTIGPLKIFRNYQSKGDIRPVAGGWNYHINGIDRGQLEEKSIDYSNKKHPFINIFIDDKGVLPIRSDIIDDKGSIDPFSILTRTISQLRENQSCVNRHHVFDGKRRFIVDVEDMGSNKKKISNDINLKCSFKYVSHKTSSSDYEENLNTTKLKSNWPFNNRKAFVEIEFSRELNYLPILINIHSPIGKIVGSL